MPRQPSPALEARLFGGRTLGSFPKLVTVLAPALACGLLTLAGWQQLDPALLATGRNQAALIAMSLSNQSYAPYLAGNQQSSANRWATFEWTNGGYSQSSVRSLTPTEATDLQ